MISRKRFGELLDGATPQNQDERDLITNYRAQQEERRKEREIEDQRRFQEKQQAYCEYYTLIKSTFPKSFFCKNPISEDEYKSLKTYCFDKYGDKITAILESPVQRTMYLIPPKHPSGDDYSYIRYLEDKFLLKEIKKRYGVDITLKSLEFKKYATSEFIEKTRAINKKYNAIISTSFSAYDYLTDYERYNV